MELRNRNLPESTNSSPNSSSSNHRHRKSPNSPSSKRRDKRGKSVEVDSDHKAGVHNNSAPSSLYYTEDMKSLLSEAKKFNEGKPHAEKEIKKSKEEEDKTKKTQNFILFWFWTQWNRTSTIKKIFFTFTVMSVILGFIFLLNYLKEPAPEPPKLTFQQHMNKLMKEFPSQRKETWFSLIAGGRDFLNSTEPQRPLVLFINGHRETQQCLGRKFIDAVGKTPHEMSAESLRGGEYGVLIENLKEVLEKDKALLIVGLERLDPKLAAALHVVCDRESPIVSRDSVVVLTADRALEEISQNWSSAIEEDKLVALITRIMNRMVEVVPEKSLPC
ncbi:uncharacterized protein LOC132202645 isoform X1 [Neocloeon triangulifer]|uniref:uncharacterized protein LOC132202645 isoform X1 n=1 Tax=Neocloeon triangulifer TaxID=2078957 RepID=UPI00286F30DF|nr:uncharacterized protein LOC132202645 isoform X1 [Neocloeon triangulifer]